jgi:signal transduction histidine kinase
MDSLQEQFIPEEKITDAAGNVRWLQTVKRPILDETGQALMVLGASTDITERKRIEETLRRREHDLQQAVEERERISEDLHDGILQSIYAIGLGLEACKPLISDQPKKSAAKLKAEIQRTIDQLNHVLEEVRNFIAGLESHILDGQDFDVVLRTMVTALAASYSIPTRVTVEKAAVQHLSTEQAYHVMHVAREALSNSFRHSHARRITLSLKCLRRSVRLSVTDNGVGFSPSTVGDAGHGLSNMASRAKKIRGNFTLRSKPRAGTTVVLDLPMRCPDAVE